MQYENFSRHLREKYSTRLHVVDQIIDRLKYHNQSQTAHDLNMIKAQQEISFPLISYLNKFESKSIENNKEFEPYFNECLLAAERIKNNRRSDRDRQICYENLILTQKLERIKKQSGSNVRKKLVSKQNVRQSINKKPTDKQSLSPNEKSKKNLNILYLH